MQLHEQVERAKYWVAKMQQFERIKGEWAGQLIEEYNEIFQASERFKDVVGCTPCAKRVFNTMKEFIERNEANITPLHQNWIDGVITEARIDGSLIAMIGESTAGVARFTLGEIINELPARTEVEQLKWDLEKSKALINFDAEIHEIPSDPHSLASYKNLTLKPNGKSKRARKRK